MKQNALFIAVGGFALVLILLSLLGPYLPGVR